jgi:hypothetical protein
MLGLDARNAFTGWLCNLQEIWMEPQQRIWDKAKASPAIVLHTGHLLTQRQWRIGDEYSLCPAAYIRVLECGAYSQCHLHDGTEANVNALTSRTKGREIHTSPVDHAGKVELIINEGGKEVSLSFSQETIASCPELIVRALDRKMDNLNAIAGKSLAIRPLITSGADQAFRL